MVAKATAVQTLDISEFVSTVPVDGDVELLTSTFKERSTAQQHSVRPLPTVLKLFTDTTSTLTVDDVNTGLAAVSSLCQPDEQAWRPTCQFNLGVTPRATSHAQSMTMSSWTKLVIPPLVKQLGSATSTLTSNLITVACGTNLDRVHCFMLATVTSMFDPPDGTRPTFTDTDSDWVTEVVKGLGPLGKAFLGTLETNFSVPEAHTFHVNVELKWKNGKTEKSKQKKYRCRVWLTLCVVLKVS